MTRAAIAAYWLCLVSTVARAISATNAAPADARSVEDRQAKLRILNEVVKAAVGYAGASEWAADRAVEVVPVRGTVFLDDDGDGRRGVGDPAAGGAAGSDREPPVANVRVSDGYTVVRSGADGSYTLWAPREFVNIRITMPSRFWTTEVMRGWFRGVDLSKADEAEVNFALRKRDWPEKITFFHCSDLDGGHRVLRHYPGVASRGPLFVEINDDLARAPFSHKWENPVVGPFTERGIPVFPTPSNHDCESGGREVKDGVPPEGSDNHRWPHRLGKWQWLRQLGPIHYSHDIGGYHLLHIDRYASRIRDGRTIWPSSKGWQRTGLPAELVLWLKEDLRYVPEDQPILFFGGDLANRESLWEPVKYIQDVILEGRKVEAAFSGEVNSMRSDAERALVPLTLGERDDPSPSGTKATFCGAPILNFGDRGKLFTFHNRVREFPGEERLPGPGQEEPQQGPRPGQRP